jgi:hypothetical protein
VHRFVQSTRDAFKTHRRPTTIIPIHSRAINNQQEVLMRAIGTLGGLALVLATAGCEHTTAPSSLVAPSGKALADQTVAGGRNTSAKGHGEYALDGTSGVQFSFNAEQHQDGTANGQFRQETTDDAGTIDIEGTVTCLSVDPIFGRAWIGGVVKRNASTDPSYALDPTTQPGQDVWFRVLDTDPATSVGDDRSTFLGFAGGGGIFTSAEYCAARLWPDDNARTHAVTKGDIEVRSSQHQEDE